MGDHELDGMRVIVRQPPYQWNRKAAGVIGVARADGDCLDHGCDVIEYGNSAHYTVEVAVDADSLKVERRKFHRVELAAHP